jgi:hypothetical protein
MIDFDLFEPRLLKMLTAAKAAEDPGVPDGPVYEDDLVKVEKIAGEVVITGNPLRIPFIYK